LINKRNYIKLICLLLSILMLLSILPAFLLCFLTYSAPGDDYMFSIPLKEGLRDDGAIALITAPIKYVSDLYMNWQGSYLSCYLFSMNPMFITPALYGITMFLFNALFAFAIFYFCFTFISGYYNLKKYISFTFASSILFSFYHCAPVVDLYEFCYGYISSVFYMLAIIAFLFFAPLLYKLYTKTSSSQKTTSLMIGLAMLAIFLGQNNLTTAISTWSGFVMILFFAYLKKHPVRKNFTSIFAILTLTLLTNALAPGYMVRYNHGIDESLIVLETSSILQVLVLSFKVGTSNIREFAFISPLIGILFLSTPILINTFDKSKKKYISPIVLLVCTYLVYIAQYVPFIFSLGNIDYGRIITYRFTLCLFFYLINYVNIISYLNYKFDLNKFVKQIIFVSCIFIGSFLIMHSFKNRVLPKSHIGKMYEQYKSGRIETYVNERSERLAILNDDSIKDVVFEPLTHKTVCFSFDFTSIYDSSLYNINLAKYYDKNSIRVKED